MVLGRPTKAALNRKKNLALAREIRLKRRKFPALAVVPNTNDAENQDADNESSGGEAAEPTGWSGGVTHCVSSDKEPILIDDGDDDEVVEELSGSGLEEAIRQNMGESRGETGEERPAVVAMEKPSATSEAATQSKATRNAFSVIMAPRSRKEWDKAESNRSLGYSGLSARTKRHREQAARERKKRMQS